MSKEQKNVSFSPLETLSYSCISMLPSNPSLYMICKKDQNGNNQVIYAGVASNLKADLTRHLDNNVSSSGLTFCYIPTSAKNALKNSKTPLYERVA